MGSTIRSTNTFEGHHVLGTADPKNPNSLVISHHSHVKTQLFKRAAAPALRLACSALSTLASCRGLVSTMAPAATVLCTPFSGCLNPSFPLCLVHCRLPFGSPPHVRWILVCLSWRSCPHRVCFSQHDDLIEIFASSPTARASSPYLPSSCPTVSAP